MQVTHILNFTSFYCIYTLKCGLMKILLGNMTNIPLMTQEFCLLQSTKKILTMNLPKKKLYIAMVIHYITSKVQVNLQKFKP